MASTWSANSQTLGLAGIKAPKNGYAYVYVSNRSDQHVYFDNLLVGNVSGNIIEENHYYAYGLKITGISSRKLGDANEGKLKNPYGYNDKEMLDEDADLNWLDYGFRNYDPQIGRFVEVDPLTNDYPVISPYLYGLNDPIGNIDVDGLFGEGVFGTAAGAVTLSEVFVYPVKAASATGSIVGFTKTAFSIGSISVNIFKSVTTAVNVFSGSFSSGPSGSSTGIKERIAQAALMGAGDAINHTVSFGFAGGNARDYASDPDIVKESYWNARRNMDIAISVIGVGMTIKGGTTAVAGLASGPAALLVSSGGALVALGGAVVSHIASSDAVYSSQMAQLYRVYASSSAPSDGPKNPIQGSPPKANNKLPDYNQARNEALTWLEERGFKAEKDVIGKFGPSKGKVIGKSTADGRIGFRIEYDARNNAHINVWAGKEKGPHFNFDASMESVINIIKKFGK